MTKLHPESVAMTSQDHEKKENCLSLMILQTQNSAESSTPTFQILDLPCFNRDEKSEIKKISETFQFEDEKSYQLVLLLNLTRTGLETGSNPFSLVHLKYAYYLQRHLLKMQEKESKKFSETEKVKNVANIFERIEDLDKLDWLLKKLQKILSSIFYCPFHQCLDLKKYSSLNAPYPCLFVGHAFTCTLLSILRMVL